MRKKKFLLNTVSALLKQLVFVVCGFILPRYILTYFGSSVNGLVASITQFLGFISFLEMGIGPVIQMNLYKPLAEKNSIDISKILISSERFFRRIAAIFVIYMVALIFIFPSFINDGFGFWYTASLILIISISTFAQYYFGITYQLLLNADQRGYIQIILQTLTMLLVTVVSVILMKLGGSIQIVKLGTAIIFLLRPLGQMLYVHKRYAINKRIALTGEPIKQKWNGFAQHLAAVIVQNTGVTTLSIFSTLQNVSIYSVYYNAVLGIGNTVMTAATGLESMWGNMNAKNETKRLNETFEIIEWAIHAGCTFLFAVTGILIVPFVKVYTNGINDANYIVPIFGALLVMSYGMRCLRIPYFLIIKAAGHYKQTQNGSFIQMTINIVLSVILVLKYGINGVAVSTLVAMSYHTVYFAWYLRQNIINRHIKHFTQHLCVDIVTVILSIIACSDISLGGISYLSWIFMALKVCVICAVISLIVNIVLYRRLIRGLIKTLKNS